MASKTISKPASKKSRASKTQTGKNAGNRKTASASIDEQLAKYRSMRDFATTAEPAGRHGKAAPAASLPFVVQKHAATRLHYDFRLGWQGVLKSWAVAKGPSYVVADKRLAVQVEDHPMEYGGFEGTIPKGQYGGGTVMLWDEGTWEPVGDADEGFRTGRLKFVLHGKKLRGHWTLIRMGGKAAQEAKPNWLLIKEHDEFERSANDESITEQAPDSAITGRSLEQIAAAEDHIWDSRSGLAADERKAAAKQSAKAKPHSVSPSATEKTAPDASNYPGEKLPGFLQPQLASSSLTPPTGPSWVHELKLDGYRMQAHLDGGVVKLFSRNGLDWTARMRGIVAALQQLPTQAAVLDGEVVVMNERGLSDFAQLQSAFDEHKPTDLTYFCFDLLHLNGHNLRAAGVVERKQLLAQLLQTTESAILRISEHLETDGQNMFSEACRLGAEGIVSKRKDAKYTSGRSPSWTKTKCILRQELVVGGYTHPAKGGEGLGALLLGYYHGDVLKYCGRAGTGFTQVSARFVRKQLDELQQKAMPFAEVVAAAGKGAIWVKPQLVAEIEFRAWTSDGMLRQAAFKGLREDKSAREVQREDATPQNAIAGQQQGPDRSVVVKKQAKPKPYPHAVIRLTHADKVIDADSGLTKQMLADYYSAVAEKMLPHIADRPLSIVRCPDGSTGKCFFQKHMKVGLPKGTGSVKVPDKKTGNVEEYITLSSKEALVGMAQMNVLELHPWGSRNEHLEQPDRMIFDLDPDEALPWSILAESAEEVRKRLQKLGLKSFLKGTGGKGLHVVVPVEPDAENDWAVVKTFAHAFAQRMEQDHPKLYLTKMTKSARIGKIYLDYLRNERGATAVAAYSPRNRAGAPASVPLDWNTLKDNAMPQFNVADFSVWLGRRQDPWKAMPTLKQKLTHTALNALGIVLR